MAARQPNLLDAWRTWNAHHRQAMKDHHQDFPNKNDKRRFCKKISIEWKKISTRYPDVHRARKLQFRQCVMRVENSRAEALQAVTRRVAHSVQRRANNVNDQPEPHEAVLQANIRVLRDLKNLIRIERTVIRQPADLIRQHDERRHRVLRDEIRGLGHEVIRVRTAFEGQAPPNHNPPGRQPSRTRYQRLPQGRNVVTPPGGHMYHYHLMTSRPTSVGIWVVSDANNAIIDRVVVKDCWVIDQNFPGDWTDPKFWFGDPMDPLTKQPTEALIHAKLSHDESIVQMRSWHMHAHKLMYRLCLEWCPFGDATDLVINYSRHYQEGTRGAVDHMIPEPAIWCAFEALIRAGLVMEQGDVDQARPGLVGGPVVHLDFKPDNLYLGDYPDQDAEEPENFAMYPSFKLADFGLSIDDRRLPQEEYRGRGTETYRAPEQLLPHDYLGQNQDPLNTRTNVWGVGITVMGLMNMNLEAGNLTFGEAALNENHPNLVPQFRSDAVSKYSRTLRNMVTHCLQFRQANRPTFHALRTQLEAATGLGMQTVQQRDYAQGARFATRNHPPPYPQPLLYLRGNTFDFGSPAPPVNEAI